MKVIQDNRIEKRFHFPMRLTCDKCNSVLEADNTDLMHDQGSQRDPAYYYVQCPLCGTRNEIKPRPVVTSEDFFNK